MSVYDKLIGRGTDIKFNSGKEKTLICAEDRHVSAYVENDFKLNNKAPDSKY